MKARKKKNLIISLAMLAVLAVSGISAYFTATDSATNKFVIGDITIDQVEDEFPGSPDNPNSQDPTDPNYEPEPKDVTPNREIPKNPKVINTSTSNNSAFVYTVVAVPKKVVKVAKVPTGEGPKNGNANPGIDGVEQMTQLFQLNAAKDASTTMSANKLNSAKVGHTSYGVTADSAKHRTANQATVSVNAEALPLTGVASGANVWTGVDTWNENWYLLDVNGELSDAAAGDKNKYGLDAFTNDYNIYLFAYGTKDKMTALNKGAETPCLFNSVTVANVINANDMLATSNENNIDYDSGIENTTPQILVKSFAIQSSNLASNETSSAVTDPAGVWAILNEQDGAYRSFADELYNFSNTWQNAAVDSHNKTVD